MDRFSLAWIWFGLAVAALFTALIAKGLAWLFSLLGIAFLVAGAYYALRR